MNRRGFLGALAAIMALDPERALWVPRKKLISIPVPVQYLPMGSQPPEFIVEQLLNDAMRNLGYVRPVTSDQLADMFLEATDLVVRRAGLTPIPRNALIHRALVSDH